MNRIPIFRWVGKYFGFVYNSYLFDISSNYLGWIEQNETVWRSNGTYLGELVDTNYILKRTNMADPTPKLPRPIPVTPIPLFPAQDRFERVPSVGWADVLGT